MKTKNESTQKYLDKMSDRTYRDFLSVWKWTLSSRKYTEGGLYFVVIKDVNGHEVGMNADLRKFISYAPQGNGGNHR